jgi:hypothetical protein
MEAMTTDGRIDAIAQSLDMLTRIVLDSQRNWEERQRDWEERWAKSEERWAKSEKRFDKIDERMAQLIDTMNRLGNIIIRHEERLDDLEDRPQ